MYLRISDVSFYVWLEKNEISYQEKDQPSESIGCYYPCSSPQLNLNVSAETVQTTEFMRMFFRTVAWYSIQFLVVSFVVGCVFGRYKRVRKSVRSITQFLTFVLLFLKLLSRILVSDPHGIVKVEMTHITIASIWKSYNLSVLWLVYSDWMLMSIVLFKNWSVKRF